MAGIMPNIWLLEKMVHLTYNFTGVEICLASESWNYAEYPVVGKDGAALHL
jgi:hypothetical protein